MPETKKPKKQKKTKESKTKASQHQSNKQRVTVNVHVGNKGGRGGKSKGGARPQPQQQQQQQMRPAPSVVVQAPQPLPPMPQTPYVAIPSGNYRPPPIQMDPGGTIAGNTQHAVDRSLSATHTVSSLPSLMGSYAPAGNTIKMPVFEDDSVSEMSFDTPISPRSNPPMDMSDFLALALPFKEQPISQPISAMKAYAKEPAPYMMPIPMSAEELDFKRYYNNMNRSVASSVDPYIKSEPGSVSSGKGPAPSVASPDRATARRDAASVFSTPSHIEFRQRMTDDSGINVNAERLKRMSKPELTAVYNKYYDDPPYSRATKADLLNAILKRFRK